MLVGQDGVELDDVGVGEEGLDLDLLDELVYHVVFADFGFNDFLQCADKP